MVTDMNLKEGSDDYFEREREREREKERELWRCRERERERQSYGDVGCSFTDVEGEESKLAGFGV